MNKMQLGKFGIDKMDDPDWYHVGNMYWCPEYIPFFKWVHSFQYAIDYNQESDFPHTYIKIMSESMKKSLQDNWSQYVE